MNTRDEIEYTDNRKFINGIMCNDAGQPITVGNGYSEEDEDNAKRSYYNANNPQKVASYCKKDKIVFVEDRDPEPLV